MVPVENDAHINHTGAPHVQKNTTSVMDSRGRGMKVDAVKVWMHGNGMKDESETKAEKLRRTKLECVWWK